MKTLDQIKEDAVVERLIMFKGHQGDTAESLEISTRGLRYILSRIKIVNPELFSKIPKFKGVKPRLVDKFAVDWEKENNSSK
jgi:hypothetical protein